jgi:hypothetical protein
MIRIRKGKGHIPLLIKSYKVVTNGVTTTPTKESGLFCKATLTNMVHVRETNLCAGGNFK